MRHVNKEREKVMLAIVKVRTAAREIMKLSDNEGVPRAVSLELKAKGAAILNLTAPIIFQDGDDE